MRSYLVSSLALRYAAKGLEAFAREQPSSWLLWEPGAWQPPRAQTMRFQGVQQVRQAAGEALALVLDPKPELTLGRGEGCDLQINDGTLSSLHLRLYLDAAGRWSVQDAGSRNGTLVDGVKLLPGERRVLTDGASVTPAQVGLTFLSPAGLFARLTRP